MEPVGNWGFSLTRNLRARSCQLSTETGAVAMPDCADSSPEILLRIVLNYAAAHLTAMLKLR
jgi:hypothetical protein